VGERRREKGAAKEGEKTFFPCLQHVWGK